MLGSQYATFRGMVDRHRCHVMYMHAGCSWDHHAAAGGSERLQQWGAPWRRQGRVCGDGNVHIHKAHTGALEGPGGSGCGCSGQGGGNECQLGNQRRCSQIWPINTA